MFSCAGLYGFGSDIARNAGAAPAGLFAFLHSDDGKAYLALMLYFLTTGLGLLPLVLWTAFNLKSSRMLPPKIRYAGSAAAYLLLPFGILPSRALLRAINDRSVTQ